MTVHTGADPRVIQQIEADVQQLARPILVAVRGRIVRHSPLLDQLRAAVQPGMVPRRGPERHRVPASRPPLNLDASDALATIYVELSGWHARHELPHPDRAQDWHKAVLAQLTELAPKLSGGVLNWLAADVASWWELAATRSGWRCADLLRLR